MSKLKMTFTRNNDFIKVYNDKIEYSSNEVQALYEDLLEKERNSEWGPNGEYWAELDITYHDFVKSVA